MESLVQEIAASISRENAASPVASMSGGSESNDQKMRIRVSEPWNGSSPIFPVYEFFPFSPGNFLPILDQSGTSSTIDYLAPDFEEKILGGQTRTRYFLGCWNFQASRFS